MKYLLFILSFLSLLITVNTGFSQNMSEKEWKKRIVGKALTGNGAYIKLNKNGTISGTSTRNGKIAQLRGTWKYTKSSGYCRKMTIVLPSGKIGEEGEACQKMNFKGGGKVEINNRTYTLKYIFSFLGLKV